MGKKQAQKGKRTMLSAILSGTAASIGISVAGAAVTAWLISSGKTPQNGMDTAAWIILFLSAACGSWIASGLTEGKKLQTAMITGGAFLTILLAVTALFFGGRFRGVWIGLILILGASLSTAMLGLRQGRGGKKQQWKRRYR